MKERVGSAEDDGNTGDASGGRKGTYEGGRGETNQWKIVYHPLWS